MRGYTTLLAVITFSAIVQVPSPRIVQAAQSDSVTVITNDPPQFSGWNSGSLSFDVSNHNKEKKRITVEFDGERNGNLDHLMISATGWSTDATKYVRSLSTTFPSRMRILIKFDKDGEIGGVDAVLPFYERALAVSGNRICSALELIIERGQVVQSSIHGEDAGRCSP